MTVQNLQTRSDLYTHDGVTALWSFPFSHGFDPLEVVVWQSSDGGLTEAPVYPGTGPLQYSVQLDENGVGGSITWNDPSQYDGTYTFRIVRESSRQQNLAVKNTSDYHPSAIEPALDDQVRSDQEIDDGRALKVGHTDTDTPDQYLEQIRLNKEAIEAIVTGREVTVYDTPTNADATINIGDSFVTAALDAGTYDIELCWAVLGDVTQSASDEALVTSFAVHVGPLGTSGDPQIGTLAPVYQFGDNNSSIPFRKPLNAPRIPMSEIVVAQGHRITVVFVGVWDDSDGNPPTSLEQSPNNDARTRELLVMKQL